MSVVVEWGSSPRGRGKPPWSALVHIWMRLIPARAGKTDRSHATAPSVPAHPRAGGENAVKPGTRANHSGSSPRGRGKQYPHEFPTHKVRLIPARAGKTVLWSARRRPHQAHPRAGGENPGTSSDIRQDHGSSPRGRGKHYPLTPEIAAEGLIPARAGKTWKLTPRRPSASAHPRAGGENAAPDGLVDPDAGSSPRGRGKRLEPARRRGVPRLIPARAGKT